MRGFLKRSAVAGATVVVLCLGVSEADAAVRVASDRMAEVRFELDGRMLTVTVVDRLHISQGPLTTIETISGSRVKVACGTTFQRPKPDSYVLRRLRWPAGAMSTTVRFRRDISRRAKWCVLEPADSGGDIASVSFHDAEPGRRLASGVLPDGIPWRLAAWRGQQLEPCLSLRRRNRASITCFSEMAETDAGIAAHVLVAQCSGATFLLGATTRSAVRVEGRLADGTAVETRLVPRPRGSRVRAQYFIALFDKPIDLATVTAYDSAGEAVARQGRSDMSGPGCGQDGW